jgi:hypothetical protein
VGDERGRGGPESEEFLVWGAPVEESALFKRVAVDIYYQSNMPHLRKGGCGEIWKEEGGVRREDEKWERDKRKRNKNNNKRSGRRILFSQLKVAKLRTWEHKWKMKI